MSRHYRWTNSDLISKMIKADYPGYKELYTFQSVLYNQKFYSLSLIQRGNDRKAVLSKRICDGYCWYFVNVNEIDFFSDDDGNRFYKTLKSKQRTSKANSYYYILTDDIIRGWKI